MTFGLSGVKCPLILFGITYRLTKGQGEFLSFQQYNLESGKVGERWNG